MISIKRTTSDNPDFEKLVVQLDAYLAILDGEDHAFYAQFNKSNALKNVLVCYEDENFNCNWSLQRIQFRNS